MLMKQALALFPAPWLMGVALGLFLFAFVLLTARAYSRSRNEEHERLARLPLTED